MFLLQITIDVGGYSGSLDTSAGFWIWGIGIIAAAFILVGVIFWTRAFLRSHGQSLYGLQKTVLLVKVPKKGAEQETEGGVQKMHEQIGVAEALFASLGGLKAERGIRTWLFGRQDQVSFEVVYNKGLINFYVACPEYLRDYLEQEINAQYPKASIEEVEDYNIFSPQSSIEASYLTFKRKNVFPIKTYDKMESDPLNAITNSLSKIDENDGAAIQFVVRSARAEWRNEGIRIASAMQQGKSLKEAMSGGGFFGGWGKNLKEMFSSGQKPGEVPKAPESYRLSPLEEEMVKGLEEKANEAGLDANIRVISASSNSARAKANIDNIINAFNQFNIYQYGNSFVRSRSKPLSEAVRRFIYRQFNDKKKIILNTKEIASLYHFPLPITETPKINWLDATKAQPPVNMPREGLLLGISEFRGREVDVRIQKKDRERHMYIIGMTGTGKSWFMDGLGVQDIRNGEGMAFIDPHGDAIQALLERVPKDRADDVIIFDPSDYERPLGMNILEYDTDDQKIFVINELLAIFDKLYDLKVTGGPMFEQYMRNALMLIMDDPESGATMLEVPKVLADEDFRRYKLSKCKTQVVKDFWEKEAQKAGGEAALQNMVPYITSKLTPFIANDLVRPIISQQKSAFNFRKVMDEGKILLVNLAKGKIGDVNANLLGMIIVGKILMAALGRADMPEEQRKNFYLYIDEFQNFLTESINVILSEARKYKLCLTVAHQYIGQLVKAQDTKFKDAIFGNVGTKVAFRIGVEDAEAMAKEFAPVFSERDLINIPKYNAYIKLLIDNANPPAFNMRTLPLEEGNSELAKSIRELSRLKYGRNRRLVEAEVMERMKAAAEETDLT